MLKSEVLYKDPLWGQNFRFKLIGINILAIIYLINKINYEENTYRNLLFHS